MVDAFGTSGEDLGEVGDLRCGFQKWMRNNGVRFEKMMLMIFRPQTYRKYANLGG